MHSDPIIDEIRRVRQAFAEKHNYNIQSMADELREHEKQHADRLVTFPPKPPRVRKSA